MKSEIVKNEKEQYKYPCLMKSKNSDTIVLFTDFCKGTVVSEGRYTIGHYSETWQDGNFEPFNGKVVLSND